MYRTTPNSSLYFADDPSGWAMSPSLRRSLSAGLPVQNSIMPSVPMTRAPCPRRRPGSPTAPRLPASSPWMSRVAPLSYPMTPRQRSSHGMPRSITSVRRSTAPMTHCGRASSSRYPARRMLCELVFRMLPPSSMAICWMRPMAPERISSRALSQVAWCGRWNAMKRDTPLRSHAVSIASASPRESAIGF